MTTTTPGMVFLDNGNKILDEILTSRLGENAKKPMEPVDIRVSDFDDVQYRICVENENRDVLRLSMGIRHYANLEKEGAKDMLADKYAGLSVTPESGFDITLEVNVGTMKESPAVTIKKMAELRLNVLGAPLARCCKALHKGEGSSLKPFDMPLRSSEHVWVRPASDRVSVVYSIDFEDQTDRALARVFLKEFEDAKRHVNNCPPVSFSKDPPRELEGCTNIRTSDACIGFVSFPIFKEHCAEAKREKTVALVATFRNYLHYHIKCSKTYLQSRMRSRVSELLQVLNRAVPQKDPSKVNKTTSSGKTFKRAGAVAGVAGSFARK